MTQNPRKPLSINDVICPTFSELSESELGSVCGGTGRIPIPLPIIIPPPIRDWSWVVRPPQFY